jgi:hypothetical protein
MQCEAGHAKPRSVLESEGEILQLPVQFRQAHDLGDENVLDVVENQCTSLSLRVNAQGYVEVVICSGIRVSNCYAWQP